MTSESRRLVTIIIGIIVGVISPCVCVLLALEFESSAFIDVMSSIDTFFWGLFLVTSVHILPSILGNIIHLRHPNFAQPLSSITHLLLQLAQNITTIVLSCYVALNQPTGLSSIGIQTMKRTRFFLLAVAGAGIYSILIVAYGLGYRVTHKNKTEAVLSRPDIKGVASLQAIWKRLVYLPILCLGVIGEELLYRGYLVLLLGEITGLPLLCGLISVNISAVVHLYQGRSTIIYHLLFATVAVGATILTGSIVMSTTMHLCANLLAAFRTWNATDKQDANQKETVNAKPETGKAIASP